MTGEGYALGASVMSGIFAVVLWAFFDALRKTAKRNTVLDILCDTAWIAMTMGVFCAAVWYTANMRFRGFMFIGVAVGGILAYFVIFPVLVRLFSLFFKIFFKIIKFIFKILLTPAFFLYKILVVSFFGKLCPKKRKVAKDDSPKKQID